MSEYQYYEFMAIDRRLNERQMREIRAHSTRAQITPSSFINEYSFVDFKGNADAWMEKYFDAHLCMTNWGTNELQLRVPLTMLPLETARHYRGKWGLSVRAKGDHLILKFYSEQEPEGGWVEADGVLASLVPIRDLLMSGDLRALYLGWLLCVQQDDLKDKTLEPPVPPNLSRLPKSLVSLVELLRIDEDLLAVAVEASPTTDAREPDREGMAEWIAALPNSEKDEILLRLMKGGDAHPGAELLLRFRNAQPADATISNPASRTVKELLKAFESRRERRELEAARQAAAAQARRQEEAKRAREKHLLEVAQHVPEVWAKIDELIATKLPKNYEFVVQHLMDLREVAIRHGSQSAFAEKLRTFLEQHRRKPALMYCCRESQLFDDPAVATQPTNGPAEH